ncbi:hypothetical protein [Ideonella sp. A 288]|uniref:hypothetical protein n=1 Tax=Ideonella sp. A 288 TaxID=1962181 RepID=UPI000B4AAFB7|nr:hypothetical protein [Ideonella sp. A 288]
MSNRLSLSMCLAPLLLAIAACGGSDGTEPAVQGRFTLDGTLTMPAGQVVVRTQAELDALSRYFVPPLPPTSFPGQMVVGISRGASRPCTTLQITDVQYSPQQTTVRFKETFRFIGSSCVTPPPITFGTLGDFVVVPGSDQPVVFVAVTDP